MLIRDAQQSDVEQIVQLHAMSFPDGWSREAIMSLLTQDTVAALVCVLDTQVVAIIMVRCVLDEAEILTLAVSTLYRRRAIGRTLLGHMVQKLAHQHVTSLFLEVGQCNKAAIALYNQCGFITMGRRKAYYKQSNGREDALTLRKQIG